jgi:hypothetical protein
MSDHCVFDYSKQPPVFLCQVCGATREAPLPMAVTELVTLSDAFTRGHRSCGKRPRG